MKSHKPSVRKARTQARRRPKPEKVIRGVYYFEHKLTEEIEVCRDFLRLCSKLARLRRGSEPYFYMSCKVEVAAFTIAVKAKSLQEIHDEMIGAMPEYGRALNNEQLKRVKGYPRFQLALANERRSLDRPKPDPVEQPREYPGFSRM